MSRLIYLCKYAYVFSFVYIGFFFISLFFTFRRYYARFVNFFYGEYQSRKLCYVHRYTGEFTLRVTIKIQSNCSLRSFFLMFVI